MTCICSTCGEEFEKYSKTLKCRPCHRKYANAYYAANKEKLKALQAKYESKSKDKTGEKECKECKETKSCSEFRPCRAMCLDCERAYGRAYRKENPDKAQAWIENNKERMQELSRASYEKNRKNIRERASERRKTDPQYKLRQDCKRRVSSFLSSQSGTKHVKLIGCTPCQFRDWIESRFEKDMTWDNYGELWHADHVIPVSHFDLTNDDQKFLCWSWANTCPMYAVANMHKKNKIDTDQILKHSEAVAEYAESHPELLDDCDNWHRIAIHD
jgi:hypothetical protein